VDGSSGALLVISRKALETTIELIITIYFKKKKLLLKIMGFLHKAFCHKTFFSESRAR